jgi:hypothetical protein
LSNVTHDARGTGAPAHQAQNIATELRTSGCNAARQTGTFEDRGTHALKGIETPWSIVAIVANT